MRSPGYALLTHIIVASIASIIALFRLIIVKRSAAQIAVARHRVAGLVGHLGEPLEQVLFGANGTLRAHVNVATAETRGETFRPALKVLLAVRALEGIVPF